MSNIEEAKKVMHQLHDGEKYGGGLVMSDQVQGTVDKINAFYEGENKDDVITAAYLHKCREKKRINPENLIPYTISDVKEVFGQKVARIVSEISSEPSDEALKGQIAAVKQGHPEVELSDKQIEWTILSGWAKGLSREAQAILLAEKLQNFEVSRDNPNESNPISWHREYYETRMIMVEAIKDASPALYNQCVTVRDEGLRALDARMIEEDTETYMKAYNFTRSPEFVAHHNDVGTDGIARDEKQIKKG